MKNARIYPTPICSYCEEKELPSDHLMRDKDNKKIFLCPVILKKKEKQRKKENNTKIQQVNTLPESPTSPNTPKKPVTYRKIERPVKSGRTTTLQSKMTFPKLFLETSQMEVIPIGPSAPSKTLMKHKSALTISLLDASQNTINEVPIKINEEFWTDNYFSDIEEPDEYHF
jgi:hypothetical protein